MMRIFLWIFSVEVKWILGGDGTSHLFIEVVPDQP